MFEPIDVWCMTKDKECVYTISESFPVSSWDWIGLYKVSILYTNTTV